MIAKQERELAKHEIADISYDLSVRASILGLDKVKDVLRNDYDVHLQSPQGDGQGYFGLYGVGCD